jgi:hypothetical protein
MENKNNVKPIIRWTIGDVSKNGFICLESSIKNFIKNYKNKFDYYVCYNTINEKKLNYIRKYPVKLLNQHDYVDELKIKPKNHPCWKLFPPRININTHEIFIDNDLVLYEKLPLINRFLKNNDMLIITQARSRAYGNFSKLIKTKDNINTGFFGLYPNFDFKKEINNILNKKIIENWNAHWDEQGLVTYIFENYKYNLIPTTKIYAGTKMLPFTDGTKGIHYIGLNRKRTKNYKDNVFEHNLREDNKKINFDKTKNILMY